MAAYHFASAIVGLPANRSLRSDGCVDDRGFDCGDPVYRAARAQPVAGAKFRAPFYRDVDDDVEDHAFLDFVDGVTGFYSAVTVTGNGPRIVSGQVTENFVLSQQCLISLGNDYGGSGSALVTDGMTSFDSPVLVKALLDEQAEYLDASTIQLLLETYRVELFRRQSFIARFGEKAQRLMMLTCGTCSWSISNEDGLESVISFFQPGTWVGITELVDNHAWRADFYAESDVTAVSWPRDVIIDRLGSNASFWRFLAGKSLNPLAVQFCYTLSDRRPLPERLALLLKLLVDRKTGDARAGALRASLLVPLSQDRLAAALRCSRQSVNESLADMRNAGILTTGREHIRILDPEALATWNKASPKH